MRKASLYIQYKEELSNPINMVLKAAEGLKISVFDRILQFSHLTKNQLAAFIETSPRTIDNYRAGKRKLGRTESEQLLLFIALYQKGQEIFGNTQDFNRWLNLPAIGLGGHPPFEFLYTQSGINLVQEELLRIEYGSAS